MKGYVWALWLGSLIIVAAGTAYCGYPTQDIDDGFACPCSPCPSPAEPD